MKCSVIRLSLFFLVIYFNYGFSLPRFDQQYPTRVLYKYNDGSTLSISDSYVEKPTLKEIIYYHIIERPYPERKEQEKTKAENPEETIDSVEAVAIDPRKDKPDKNRYSTEKPDHGKRQRREVSLETNTPERRSKRANYRSWVPFSPDMSRMHIQHLPEYVREILTDKKPFQTDQTETLAANATNEKEEKNNLEKALLKTIEVEEAEDDKSSAADTRDRDLFLNKLRNPKYAYLVGHLSSTLAEKDNEVKYDDEVNSESSNDESDILYNKPDYINEPNVVEYLEYDEFDENNGSEDDAGVSITKEKDLNEHNKPGASDVSIESTTSKNNKDSGEHSKLSGNSEDDWSDKNTWDDNYSDEDSSSIEDEDIGCEHREDCDESGEDISLNFDDILKEIHQVFIDENSTIELEPGMFDNPENFNILKLLHNVLKEHSKSTTQAIVIKAKPNQSNFLDVLRGLFTNIVKNNVIINNNVPVTPESIDIIAEKDKPDDRENPGENTEKPVSEQNLKDDNTTTENPKEKVTPTNNSSEIDQSKEKDVTSLPLESTTATVTVKNPTEIDKNKSNDTDKLIQVNSTTPAMETESSSKGTEKSTTPTPIKIDSNITNEKVDGADVDKKIDYMLDLVNNDFFWKFMGDLGGKYLESLMTHTSSVIKEQISAQVKEHLEALNKLDEKLALEKKKDEVKENKPVKDNFEGKNTETKNINEAVSIKAHNLFGNTVGNDKVTNVYVFYANEHIDEIIKNIHKIANKTKAANGTNIFTFVPNQIELNNGTSKPTTTIVSEVTTELPKITVNHVADKPNDEHKPTEPTTNGFGNIHPNNVDNHTQTVSNCDHDQSHCNKNEVSTKPSINIDQPDNITVHTTENNLDSTTVGKEQTFEVTTPVVDLIPEKVPVTETTDKPEPTTENISSKEPITEVIVITTESIATKQTTAAPVTNIDVQTETTLHSTQNSKTTTDANLTTEPVIPQGTTIPDTTTGSTTESVNHQYNDTSLNTNTNDVDKDKVTTESMKPVTDNSSSTTEITSTISDTITGRITEKSKGISHQSNKTSLYTTSENDKAKVTTESMKPVTDNISSTTEITSTISDTTTGSTIAKSEGVSHQNNDTSLNTNTSEDNKANVTTESMKPVTDKISSTEFASSTETTTSHYNASSNDPTESDLKDISTTKSSTKKDEDTNHTSTEPSLNIDLSGDDKKDKSNNTESVTDIKLTTEAVSTKTVTSVDQADNKNHTVLNNENNNSTADHSESISTTESLEHKTDSINITTEATTGKTTENANSTNDESKITTDKSESTKAATESKGAIESTTEKHEEAIS